MPDPDRPLLGEINEQFRLLAAELREMAMLRWQLARIELQAAADQVRRLAIFLAVCIADLMDGTWGISRAGWAAIFAGLLLAGGILIATLGWRWFRRHYAGLRETSEELREDLVWLGEWTGRSGDE
jgi:hypothetical protein